MAIIFAARNLPERLGSLAMIVVTRETLPGHAFYAAPPASRSVLNRSASQSMNTRSRGDRCFARG